MSGSKSRFVRLAAVSLALVCLSIGLNATPASAQETGTVTGRVVRGDGGSVDQLEVMVLIYLQSDSSQTVVTTTADGRFTIPNVPAGNHVQVVVTPPNIFLTPGNGYLPIPVQGGEVADLGDIVLEYGGAVTGTITVATGSPSSDMVRVCVGSTAGWETGRFCSEPFDVGSGTTASYEIPAVPSGTYLAGVEGYRVRGQIWFSNAMSPQDATALTVTAGSARANVNFSVSLLPDTVTPSGPTRVIETRPGRPDGAIKVAKAKVGPAQPLNVKLAGAANVPASNIAAASLVVTVTNPTQAGYVTVYPCGTRPTTSSVNFAKGQTVANAVVAPISDSGNVCFFASADTDLIVDVNGYLPAHGGFIPRTPARLMETRPGRPADLANVSKTKIRPGATKRINLASISGLGDATMLSLNVTATGSTLGGHVSAYACSSVGDTTSTSTVNFAKGSTVANAALVATSSKGGLCVSSSVPVDVVIDINGVFDHDTGLATVVQDITGGRMFDTRPGRPSFFDRSGKIGGGTVLTVPTIQPGSGVYNVTVVAPGSDGYITAYPCGKARPTTSNINFSKGVTVAGLVISGNSGGTVCVYSSTPVDLIVDVFGEFAGANAPN